MFSKEPRGYLDNSMVLSRTASWLVVALSFLFGFVLVEHLIGTDDFVVHFAVGFVFAQYIKLALDYFSGRAIVGLMGLNVPAHDFRARKKAMFWLFIATIGMLAFVVWLAVTPDA